MGKMDEAGIPASFFGVLESVYVTLTAIVAIPTQRIRLSGKPAIKPASALSARGRSAG